jgi:6,7-dimethyl-8-ribityllumazine synthase
MKIGVVTAEFNRDITERLEQGALRVLEQARVEIVRIRVPGAVEIPLMAQALLKHGCDGVVALGCVIRGETSHYDSVCRMVEAGCNQVMLEFTKPIGFGVLTTENDEQAMDRAGGAHGNKGAEAAEVTLMMIRKIKTLELKTPYQENSADEPSQDHNP